MNRIYFMHIPKCGGTTLHQLLDDEVSYDKVLLPVIKDPRIVDRIRTWKKDGLDINAELNKWFAGYQRFHGHTNVTGMLAGGWDVFTFLRDPVDRLVSLYNHWRTFTDSELAAAEKRAPESRPVQDLKRAARERSLAEFLALYESDDTLSIAMHFNNGMCNAILSNEANFPRRRLEAMTEEEKVERTIAELGRMKAVGILERMDESLALIYHNLAMRPRRMLSKKNAREYDKEQVIGDAAGLVARMTEADRRVYEWACRQLDEQLAALKQRLDAVDMDAVYRRLEDEYVAARRREYAAEAQSGTLPVRLDMGMRDGMYLDNWHEREGLDTGSIYRWSGPGRESSIDVGIRPARGFRVRMDVVSVLYPDQLDQAEIAINGRWVPARMKKALFGREEMLTAEFPGEVVGADGFARIGLRVPRTASHEDLHPGCGDRRQKGLAVGRVIVEPV